MNNKTITIAAISGAVAVALGAFGAHGLKSLLTPEQAVSFETAVRYQFIHTLAALFVALLAIQQNNSKLKIVANLFFVGILLFSGSLYLLNTRMLLGMEGLIVLGPVTPLGGLCFVGGWLYLAVNQYSVNSKK